MPLSRLELETRRKDWQPRTTVFQSAALPLQAFERNMGALAGVPAAPVLEVL